MAEKTRSVTVPSDTLAYLNSDAGIPICTGTFALPNKHGGITFPSFACGGGA